ncbi:MAG: methyl-accepting chemotaxis protein [Succinivibrio sp.]
MNFLAKLSIPKKFMVVILTCMSLLVVIAVTSIYKATKTSNSSDLVVHKIMPAIESLGQVNSIFKEFRICAIKLPTATPETKVIFLKKYAQEKQNMLSHRAVLSEVLKADQINEMVKIIDSYDAVVQGELSAAVEKGNVTEATKIIADKLVPLGNAFDEVSEKLKSELTDLSADIVEELKADVDPTINILTIIFVIIASAASLQYLSRSISSRVVHLARISEKISSGDLTSKIKFCGYDEIGRLANDIEHIIGNLTSIVVDMKGDSSSLIESSHDLHETADKIKDKSNNVLDKLITVSSASEEMAATSQEISSNCSLAATSSNETQKVAQQGMSVVETTVNDIKLHSEKTQHDAQLILELGKKTDEINKIISTIEDIASQTNLLALNAAIEAARAGEHGKGFAVVADEVRALAVRTAEATKEISTMITTVNGDVKAANESITDTVSKMQVIADNAGALLEALDVITSKIGDVNMQITQIASATEQQSGTAKEMSSNLQTIKVLTQEMAEQSASTDSITRGFAELSDRMEETVSKFTV